MKRIVVIAAILTMATGCATVTTKEFETHQVDQLFTIAEIKSDIIFLQAEIDKLRKEMRKQEVK